MSLIIDAIKKAQEIRLKELKRPPFLKSVPPKNPGTGEKRRMHVLLSLVGGGILLLSFALLWRNLSPLPPVSSSNQGPAISQKVPELEETRYLSNPVQQPSLQEPAPKREPIPQGLLLANRDKRVPLEQENLEETKKQPTSQKIARTADPPPPQPAEERKDISPPTPSAEIRGDPIPKPEPPPATEATHIESMGTGRGGSMSEAVIHYNQAVEFDRGRDYERAIRAYEKAIALDPKFVEAYNNLGVLYQERGLYEKALEVFEKGIEVAPTYEKIFNNLGTLLLLRGRYGKAKEAFERALSINPRNLESHINLGIVLKKEGRWDQALESFRSALSLDPTHAETHYNIGLFYDQLGRRDLAIHHYEAFVELSSKKNADLVPKVRRRLNDLRMKGSDR